jgi:hypothetical protein
MLDAAVHGRFPEPDGCVEFAGSPPEGPAGIVAFTAHTVIAVDVDEAEAAPRVPPGDLSRPMSPEFVQWLAGRTGMRPGTLDAVFAALAVGGEPAEGLERIDPFTHPRIDRAARYREGLRVYATPDREGVVVLGRGLTRRWELAFEVDEHARDRGLGRRLARAALSLLPEGTPLWMQIAPGNARSMRAAIGAGFQLVGAEILLVAP